MSAMLDSTTENGRACAPRVPTAVMTQRSVAEEVNASFLMIVR
jgi:hypothetical protein